MKSIRTYILAACLVATSLASCDRLLDVNPDSAMDQEQMKDVEALVNGMYVRSFGVAYYGRNAYVFGDIGTDNVCERNNGNRFFEHFRMGKTRGTSEPVSGSETNLYDQVYRVVVLANQIIANGAATDEQRGQAYFWRALAHHDLVKFYGPVPVVTAEVDLANPPGNSSEAAVYTQILKDLDEAERLLKNTTNWNKATPDAVNALRTRVYLFKKDYAKVVESADKLKGFSLIPAAQYASFFNASSKAGIKSEAIFEIRKMTDQSTGSDDQGRIYTPSPSGYGAYTVNPEFAKSHQANDVRRSIYVQTLASQPGFYYMLKFKEQEGVTGLHSPKLLRYAEVLLNKAEALVQLGNPVEAAKIISTIREARLLNPTAEQLANEGSLTTVLEERRKELAFEGHRIFDLRRNNLPVRLVDLKIPAGGDKGDVEIVEERDVIPAGDKQFWHPIPERELNANPNIKPNFGY